LPERSAKVPGASEFDHDSGRRYDWQHSIQLAEDAPGRDVIEIETRIADVLAIQEIQDLACQRQFRLLEQEGLADAHVDAIVVRQSGEVALAGQKVIRANLPDEFGNRQRLLESDARSRVPGETA